MDEIKNLKSLDLSRRCLGVYLISGTSSLFDAEMGARYAHQKLRREIGNISPVSTQALRELESYGLVARAIYPVIPPRVEYSLTELGETLVVALNALRDWAMDNNARVEEAIELFKEREKAEKTVPCERGTQLRPKNRLHKPTPKILGTTDI